MTEWLLSGHNTQETTGVAFPVTVTMTEHGLDAQIRWFLGQVAGDTSDFDHTMKPTEVIQGRLYLNINYYARNMAAVMPFDPESVGAPSGLVEAAVKPPLGPPADAARAVSPHLSLGGKLLRERPARPGPEAARLLLEAARPGPRPAAPHLGAF